MGFQHKASGSLFFWSLWSEASTEGTSEESIYLRERTDGQEPRCRPPSHLQADVLRLGVFVPCPWKGPRSSSDLMFCAELGFRFASRLRGGGLAFGRSDRGELLHLEIVLQRLRGVQSRGPYLTFSVRTRTSDTGSVVHVEVWRPRRASERASAQSWGVSCLRPRLALARYRLPRVPPLSDHVTFPRQPRLE